MVLAILELGYGNTKLLCSIIKNTLRDESIWTVITHSLKLLHSFTDCLQTLGTLCREGNKDNLPSKRLYALLSLLLLQDELLVLCEIFLKLQS